MTTDARELAVYQLLSDVRKLHVPYQFDDATLVRMQHDMERAMASYREALRRALVAPADSPTTPVADGATGLAFYGAGIGKKALAQALRDRAQVIRNLIDAMQRFSAFNPVGAQAAINELMDIADRLDACVDDGATALAAAILGKGT